MHARKAGAAFGHATRRCVGARRARGTFDRRDRVRSSHAGLTYRAPGASLVRARKAGAACGHATLHEIGARRTQRTCDSRDRVRSGHAVLTDRGPRASLVRASKAVDARPRDCCKQTSGARNAGCLCPIFDAIIAIAVVLKLTICPAEAALKAGCGPFAGLVHAVYAFRAANAWSGTVGAWVALLA